MSDTLPRDQTALLWNAKPRAARVPRPGDLAWRLRHADGRVQWRQLRNHTEAGGTWEVQLFEDGDLLFGRRCADERLARYAATGRSKICCGRARPRTRIVVEEIVALLK